MFHVHTFFNIIVFGKKKSAQGTWYAYNKEEAKSEGEKKGHEVEKEEKIWLTSKRFCI